MPIRLSGLVSNMDTEGIVKELMSAQNYKKTKIQNKITLLEWKQDKWKTLNSSIYSLYTGPLSKLRLQGNYNTLKASSSNENKLTVTASNSAPVGTHTLEIKQLASGQYVTGNKVADTVKNNTKLSALGFDVSAGTTLTIKGTKTAYLDIGATTTVADFTQACKNAGLNASYDANQHRFFISSKESGTANAFTMTAESTLNTKYRNIIRNSIDYAGMTTSQKDSVDSALFTCVDTNASADAKAKAKETVLAEYEKRVRVQCINQYMNDADFMATVRSDLKTSLNREPTDKEFETALAKKAEEAANTDLANYTAWKSDNSTEPETHTAGYELFKESYNKFNSLYSDYVQADSNMKAYLSDVSTSDDKAAARQNILNTYTKYADASEAETYLDTLFTNNGSTNQNDIYTKLGLSALVKNDDGTIGLVNPDEIKYVASSDSKIVLDNAEFVGNLNTMTINGMTLNLKALSDTNGVDSSGNTIYSPIKFTVSNDTDAVYNMIKSFVKSYNDVLSSLNTAYDAETAKGYEPLTDEQKEAMTDTEIEKWETKIKDSLLRRDSTIRSLTSILNTNLSKSVTVNDKKYTLASFGIGSVNYSENGQLHINGDSDDSKVSDMENKLKSALENDPDTVMQVFSKLASDLYSDLTGKMKSTTLRSALTFYNDKEIKKQITDYKSDLSVLEDKLNDIEDRYYKQFTAMETAMAKLNSQSSYLASLLGQ